MNLDKHPVELTCPACGHKFKQLLGGLKNDPTIDCPGCHSPIKIEAKGLRDGLKSVDASLADLQKAIKGFGKR
jgi:DNA-directed RNA polymerase subunit RPC12/RpoP